MKLRCHLSCRFSRPDIGDQGLQQGLPVENQNATFICYFNRIS